MQNSSPKFFASGGEGDEVLSPSPIPEETPQPVRSPSRIQPERVPNLSFLSANFSSDSIDANSSVPTPTTPSRQTMGDDYSRNMLSAPFSRRNSNSFQNSSTPVYSPPVSRYSHLHHQRTGSNSMAARPKSMLAFDSLSNAIFESEDAIQSHDRVSKRDSFHSTSRPLSQYIPQTIPAPSTPDTRQSRSRSDSPVRMPSPRRRSKSPIKRSTSPTKAPFNFKSQEMPMMHSNSSNSSLVVKPAHRKGHRYKHSSVSMNLFQEPTPLGDVNTQQNLIPDLYPIPSLRESWSYAKPAQKYKAAFSLAHFVTSIIVFTAGAKLNEASFSTLAHLVFYDSLGSIMVAFVDIMSNFEVWNKSSIAYPFGLGRLEVLSGFALSASLVMVGCDLVSHFVEEMVFSFVEHSGDEAGHGSHHIHDSEHTMISPTIYASVLLLVMLMTWFTSTKIYDKGSISDMMSDQDTKSMLKSEGLLSGLTAQSSNNRTIFYLLRQIVKNPIRLLTLTYCLFLLIIPVIPKSLTDTLELDVDEASTLVVASFLCYAGWRLVSTLGGILLVSFPYTDYDYHYLKAAITDRILDLPNFRQLCSLDHCFLTKVNYQLYIVGAKVTMVGGSTDDESRLIFEMNRVLKRTITGFDSDCSVEITIDIQRSVQI